MLNKKFFFPVLFVFVLSVCNGAPSFADNSFSASASSKTVISPEQLAIGALPMDKLAKRARRAKEGQAEHEYLMLELKNRVPRTKEEVNAIFDQLDDAPMTLKADREIERFRTAAQLSLQKTEDPALLPLFVKRIKHGSLASRYVAMDVVAKFKAKDAVPDLIDMVDGYEKSEHKISSVISSDLAAYKYAQDAVKEHAAETLGDIGDERAIPVLMKNLKQLDIAGYKALAKFGLKIAPQLLAIVEDPKQDDDIKSTAAAGLGSIRDKNAVPYMWQVLTGSKEEAKRCALLMLLATCDATTKPSREEVEKYIYAEFYQGRFVEEAIDLAREKKDADFLIAILQRKNLATRWKWDIIPMMSGLNSPAVIPLLEGFLNNKDEDETTRMKAARTLTEMTGRKYKVQ